jgi:HEAT repeat protein
MNRRILLTVSVVVITTALALFSSRQGPEMVLEPKTKTETQAAKSTPEALKPVLTSKTGIAAEIAEIEQQPEMARRLALVEKLAALGPGAIPMLSEMLLDAKTSASRGILADALARIGTSEAVDALFGILASTTDAAAKAEIAQSFAALPPGQAIETLASGLSLMLDPPVRDAVVATVGRAADSSIVTFLNELYHEPEAFTGQHENITAALGSIQTPAAIPALADLLRHTGEEEVMRPAAASLGRIGTADSLQPLAEALTALDNTNPELRLHFLSVIQSVTNPEAVAWLEKAAANAFHDADLATVAKTALDSMKQTAAQ